MKKTLHILFIFGILIGLCACSKDNKSGIYKYYSLNIVPETGEDSDVLNNAFAKEIFDTMLKDSYLEIDQDGTVHGYSTTGGFTELDFSELFDDDSDETDFEQDGDLIHFSSNGWTLTYKKATAEEVSVYKQLVKSSQENNGQTESGKQSEIIQQTETANAATEEQDTESEEGYHMENIPIPENEGSLTLVATGGYCFTVADGDGDGIIPPGKYIFVPVYPEIIKTQDHEYPASWMIYVSDEKYSYFSELSYLDHVGDAGGVSQNTIEIEVSEGDYVYAIDLHENNEDDPENGFSVGECEMCWLGE